MIGDTITPIRTGAYVVDGRGVIVAVNAVAERLLGRPAAGLVGADAHDLLHRTAHGETCRPPSAACGPPRHRPAQDGGEWFEKGDGTLLPVAWSITPTTPEPTTPAPSSSSTPARPPPSARRARVPRGALDELERLALLAETTTQLTSTLSVDEAMRRLVALVLPRLADWAVIDLISERDEVWRTRWCTSRRASPYPVPTSKGRWRASPPSPRCRCPAPCGASPRRSPAPRPTTGPPTRASPSSNVGCSRPRVCTRRPSPPSGVCARSSAP
ncbi:hypothetical protein ACFQV4_30900 [Streptomyces thermocarboxydus]